MHGLIGGGWLIPAAYHIFFRDEQEYDKQAVAIRVAEKGNTTE